MSPMQRCLETADPLITRLNYKATVLPLIFESPGLCHKYDRDFFCKSVEPLVTSNDMENAIKIYNKHRFRDAGLSQNSIHEGFRGFMNVLCSRKIQTSPGIVSPMDIVGLRPPNRL